MFDKAVRLKLRFSTPAGLISAEDLWDLPLTSTTGKANLDGIAKELFQKIKNNDPVSFVVKEQKSDDGLQLKFDVVKYVIDTRLAENEAASTAKANKEKKQQLLALIAQKEYEQLAGNSLDNLRKMAESL